MAATIITPNQDAIVSEIEIAAPPQRVFEAISSADQLQRWWSDDSCPCTDLAFEPRKGGKWRMTCGSPDGKFEFNGRRVFKHTGEILEYDPPRLLAYTWLADFHIEPSRRTVVRWELTPTKTGTKVKMTHSGLAQELEARTGYSQGWPGVLASLKKFSER